MTTSPRSALFARAALATLFAAACLAFTACETPVPAPLPAPKPQPANPNLAGTWRSTLDDGTLTLRQDGTFTVAWPATGRAGVNGKWTVSGGGITFTNDAGSATCPGVPGNYLFQVRGDIVNFSPLADDCQSRLDSLRVPWVRLPPPQN